MSVRMLAALLLLGACNEEQVIRGEVVDVWGDPIEGATVMMEGLSERPLTDAHGRFSLPFKPGTHKLKAGRDGYIQDHQELEVADGSTEPPRPVFKLYQKPQETGFYVVGNDKYYPLEHQTVEQMGNELDTLQGIRSTGDVRIDGSRGLEVVFHTDLSLDEIHRLGLELHKLDYVREAELQGAFGSEAVDVKLYTSAGEVPVEIVPMRSRTDYMIRAKGELEPGAYALQVQNLLDTKDATAFGKIPDRQRVVWPILLR